jgi:predicted GTPase
MGAAGRDFHNFLVFYKNNPDYRVIAFTATQIPGISKRNFPKSMAGKLYKRDIPIYPEERLFDLIKKNHVDVVVFAYSDVSDKYISEKNKAVEKCGASFVILGPKQTMLKSNKPVISVCSVRTGAGKSPTTRKISHSIRQKGLKVVVVRHPMPYGNLKKQEVQRFGSYRDFNKHSCTIEEREEYESHVKNGVVVYAGVDYEKILRKAEKEADVIIWDGGNNDFPFYEPDLNIVIADARRPGHELTYYHGAVNVKMADIVIINKVKTAKKGAVKRIEKNIKKLNSNAIILKANMTKTADKPELIKGKRVLIIEDGPTLTHGGLSFGAGYLAAKKYKAKIIVNPRKYAVGSLKKTFDEFKHLKHVLPAMGYGSKQIKELEETINQTQCDSVIVGTPVDLGRYLKINKPVVNVTYEIHSIGKTSLENVVEKFFKKKGIKTKH